MTEKLTGQTSLTKFKDCLRVPPILRPHKTDDQRYNLRIQMRPAQVQLHSELPPSEVWTYEGSLPGPTIEVSRGQRVQVEWINAIPLDKPYPITAVTAPDGTQNEPGRSGRQANQTVATLPPWTVAHLHGGRTAAVSDGWTENASLSGQTTTCDYTNDQQATLLWYHDHAMGITRFNVYAALPGSTSSAMPRKQRCTCPLVPTRSPCCSRIATWKQHPTGRSLVAHWSPAA